MISECVAIASCLMLTAAQLQMPIQQVLALPNLHPMQLTSMPNSELLMTQSAHSILNDASSPLSPGILGGAPILVSEAAQSILDQESRIVGYTLPAGLQAVIQQAQQHPTNQQAYESFNSQSQFVIPSPPQIIPITQNDAVNVGDNGIRPVQFQSQPESLSIPVLNQVRHQQPVNVVPARAQVSLKSLLTSQKPSDRGSLKFNAVHQPARAEKVYYDIPPNHPIPAPPPSFSQYPHENLQESQVRSNDYYSTNKAVDQSQSQRGEPHYQVTSDEEVVFMRPPPPFLSHSFFRPAEEDRRSEDSHRPRTQSQKTQDLDQYRYQEDTLPLPPLPEEAPSLPSSTPKSKEVKDKSQRRKKPKNRQSKPGDTGSESRTNSKSKHGPIHDSIESPSNNVHTKSNLDLDSSSQSSESSFLTALLQSQQRNNPLAPPVYESNNNYNYPPTNDPQSVVHKHIFVHAAPETYSQGPRVRVIRPPVNQEKHLQIIFVKSPTEAPATETIVELPPAEQQKTLVYILSKKPEEAGGDVKVISPPTRKPHAPEIYFIRYGDRRENQGYPVPDLQSLNLNENNNNYHTSNSDQLPVATPNSLSPQLVSFLRQKRHRDYGLDVYAPLMAYSSTGQINEITQEEANSRKSNLNGFF